MKKFKLYEYVEKLSKDDLVVTSDSLYFRLLSKAGLK